MNARLLPIAAAAFVCALSAPVSAQWVNYKTPGIPRLPDGKANLSAPAPRTPDGKPDLSGVWQAARTGQYGYDYNVAANLKPEETLPWAETLRQQRVQNFRKDSPLARCLPVSVPFLNFRGLSQIVQTPGLIVVMHESPNSPHRSIYTDGRPLPKDITDLTPTWLGYSVGHWDGDTMVVESTGFNDLGWLDVGGHPQTESLRITERLRRRDFGHMEYEMTIDDPKVFTRPVVLRGDKTLAPDTVILEDVCENEQSGVHLVGGVKVAPEMLAKYAGTYEFAPGRQAVVTVSGDQLLIQDSAHPADRLFVASSQTLFLSSLSQASVEFAKDAKGTVTHFVRMEANRTEKAMRSDTQK